MVLLLPSKNRKKARNHWVVTLVTLVRLKTPLPGEDLCPLPGPRTTFGAGFCQFHFQVLVFKAIQSNSK